MIPPLFAPEKGLKITMSGSLVTTIWTICYFVVLCGLSLYGLHRYVIVYLFLKNRNRPPKPLREFEKLPRITVQLPIFNEMYVVERLLKSVSALDYPRELLQVQVLDDSTDETTEIAAKCVAELKGHGLDIDLVHRTDRSGFKAGALEAGMDSCTGEFVLILDADFVPAPDMLRKTVHFFTDPKVGMIQTRWGHLNRTYSVLTRVQAMFLDGHLLLEQTARSRAGRFFNFNGTAGLWRRSCIADSGGWQHDTLTEDLDLSYRAQLKGWRFIFLPDLVTPAELPVDMNGFKSQQHRWTKGSIQTCMKLLPAVWRADLPLLIKLESTAHLTANYAYLLLFFLCVLMHPATGGDGPAFSWQALLINVPIYLSASLPAAIFYVIAQRELHPKTWLRELVLLPMVLALGIGLAINNARAVLEAMFGHQSEFTRTPKYGIQSKTQSWKKARYLPLKSVVPFIEMLFAIYFSYLLGCAVAYDQWLNAMFLSLFLVGFSYVALCSLAQWMPNLRFPGRDSGAPLAA
jgi:cellulose synthase/poly-beta-1,6-N-acetylglucosamine synthase-like glycosyltransferase